jgi:hypothetical protein
MKWWRFSFMQEQRGGKQMKKSPYARCSRCGGNMVYESFFGPDEPFTGLKCVICGEVIDPVILRNRQRMNANPVMILPDARRATAGSIRV